MIKKARKTYTPQAGIDRLEILGINLSKEEALEFGLELKETPEFGRVERFVPLCKLTDTPGVFELPKQAGKDLYTNQIAGIYKSVFGKEFNVSDHIVTEDLKADAVRVVLTCRTGGRVFNMNFEWFSDPAVPYKEFNLQTRDMMTKTCYVSEIKDGKYSTKNNKTGKYEWVEGVEEFVHVAPAPTKYKEEKREATGTFTDLVQWFKQMLSEFVDSSNGLYYSSRDFDFYNEIGGDALVQQGDTSNLVRLLEMYNGAEPVETNRGIYTVSGIVFSRDGKTFTKVYPGYAQALRYDNKGNVVTILVDAKVAELARKHRIYMPVPIKKRGDITVEQMEVLIKKYEKDTAQFVKVDNTHTSDDSTNNSPDYLTPSSGPGAF